MPYFNQIPHQLPFASKAFQRMMFLILKISLKLSIIQIISVRFFKASESTIWRRRQGQTHCPSNLSSDLLLLASLSKKQISFNSKEVKVFKILHICKNRKDNPHQTFYILCSIIHLQHCKICSSHGYTLNKNCLKHIYNICVIWLSCLPQCYCMSSFNWISGHSSVLVRIKGRIQGTSIKCLNG